jgi:formylglycine-generating enzyme required for sulfatase activity
MKSYFVLLLSMAVLFSFCTKNFVPVRGTVTNSKNPSIGIEGVRVVVSNRPPVVTDASGEFYIDDFDLDKYIVDSITFNLRDPSGNYFPKIVNEIIGNRQQTPFNLQMDPIDDLEYSPQILSIGTSVSSGIINISNKGIDSMKCIISASCPWVLFGQNNIIVPPVGGFNLNIQTITTNIQCKDSCWVYIEWGNNNKDSIQIVKDILDTQKPSANFTVSDQTPNQFQQFDCDASLSNDNCSTILFYRWSFDNGANWSPQPSPNPKVSYIYNVQGNQTIIVEVTDEQGNKSTYSQTVLVLLAPTPPQLNPTVSLSNGGLLCINASAILMDCGQTFTGLLDHGFVWSSSIPNPTIDNTAGGDTLSLKAFNGISGNFSATICKKLQPKTYYIRAFARNGYDTTYSNTFTFTLELLDYTTVTQGGSQINFEMGDNSASEADVKPQHKVILTPFKISTSEITNAQFAVFLNSGYAPPLEISDFFNSPAIGQSAGMWKVEDGKENHPVVNVSWLGAKAFCTFANGRLPTEAEWECAAKEKKPSFPYARYSGGNSLDVFGWYNFNATALKEVKTRASNVLGIFDLSGNVREWCSDWYDPNYYTPTSPPDPQGPSSSPTGERVLRGGSFALPELPARVYYRDKRTPGTKSTDIGFRCVKN